MKLSPSLRNVWRKYQSWGNEDDVPFEYAKYYQLSTFIQMTNGQQTEALATSRKGVEAVGKAASANSPIYQSARFFLAHLMSHAGNLEECLKVNEDVLRGRKRLCGEFNHFTLESCSMCAELLLRQGDLDKAE